MGLAAIWLALGRLTSEHYFSQESGRQSLMWYGGMWRVALYLSHTCLPFFNTSSIQAGISEHLNDQNSATWLSAPALSNLDGYVSASEGGRHGRYTYTTQICTRTYTHTFAHKSSVTSPDSQMPLDIPSTWDGQKSGKMCSSVEMQSVIQLSKTSIYLFSVRLEGKRPESFYSTFIHSSAINREWITFYQFKRK